MTELVLKSIVNKSNAQRLVNSAKSSYATDYNIVMTTDVEVTGQSSKEKREAAASVKVTSQYTVLQEAEDALAQAVVFNQVMSTLAKDLEIKQDLLLEQINLIRMTLQVHQELRNVWNPNTSLQ